MTRTGTTVLFTSNGAHGFTNGNTVVIGGYAGGNAGLNGTFVVANATTYTFEVTNGTGGLPASLNFNTEGYAISENTTSALRGAQRSMVDSVAYTFNVPVNLSAVNLSALTVPTVSGPAVPAVSAPGTTLTSLNGGLTWVVTFNTTGLGHSIASGRYQIQLDATAVTAIGSGLNMTAANTNTFYRLFGDSTGFAGGFARVNSADNLQLGASWLKVTPDPLFNVALDASGDGRVNATDLLPFSGNWLSAWSGFTSTI
jgi:hypothetical protein